MNHDTLRDPSLKISRAKDHMQEIVREIRAYAARRPYRVFDGINPSDNTPAVMAVITEPLPDKVSQIAGDLINNIRESLDQLMVHLAKKNGRGESGVRFPTGKDAADLRTVAADAIKNLSAQAQDLVLAQDAYQYGKGHALWALNSLWNINKHRRFPGVDIYNGGVHALVDTPTGRTWFGAGGAGSGYLSSPRLLFHNSKVADFIEIEIALYPVFSDAEPAPQWLITQLLDKACAQAEEILTSCRSKFFT